MQRWKCGINGTLLSQTARSRSFTPPSPRTIKSFAGPEYASFRMTLLDEGSSFAYKDELLLDAEQRATVCGHDDVKRSCSRDVFLVPYVVKSVGLVCEVEEPPGQI